MKINNREYGYSIEPMFGKVRAEIYKVSKSLTIKARHDVHIHLLHKDFGRWYRKPIREDYEKAREWVNEQLGCMFRANRNAE